jgi:poly-gamma-glutamate synthesis protein (capsule biosynthesis protein)
MINSEDPMDRGMALPRTPRDLFKFRRWEAILFDGLIAFFKVTRKWKYPVRANGDLERMTFLDKVYWLYKASNPIGTARRGSGLEAFFRTQAGHLWRLPEGLKVSHEQSLSAVGDLIDHPFLAHSSDTLYRNVSEIVFGADIAMANLECPILPGASGRFEFNTRSGPPLYYGRETFDVVKGYGNRKFAFLAAACNHSLDFGAEGVDSTIRVLREAGIAFHGINETEDAAATVLDRNGIRTGVIAFTFGLNAHRPPPERPLIVNRMELNETPEKIDFRLMERQLRQCRDAGVDFVVAHLHWGLEHELYPTPEQVRVAHHMAELGVDAIVGHHPHVVQPMEFYRTRRDPNRVVPVFYSLGNLINAFSAPFLCRSLVARIELAKGLWTDGSVRTYVKRATASAVIQVAGRVQRKLALEPA